MSGPLPVLMLILKLLKGEHHHVYFMNEETEAQTRWLSDLLRVTELVSPEGQGETQVHGLPTTPVDPVLHAPVIPVTPTTV